MVVMTMMVMVTAMVMKLVMMLMLRRRQVNAMNGLEQTCYSTRNNLDQSDLKEKLTAEESEQLDVAVKAALQWIEESGADAELSAIEEQQKALESVVHPIMTRLYQEGDGSDGGGAGGEEDTSAKE